MADLASDGSRRLRVADGAVDVWAVRVGGGDPGARRSASEVALRTLLGGYVGRDPSRLAFVRGAFGKPRLAEMTDEGALHFNLSRSGDRCLIAVTWLGSIGVDVERLEPFDHLDHIAARLFSPAEAKVIASSAEHRRTRLFYDCWARKEAYVKALGTGVNTALDSFSVSLDDGEAPSISGPGAGDGAAWAMRSLRPWDGFVAAVVVRRGRHEPSVTVRHLDLR